MSTDAITQTSSQEPQGATAGGPPPQTVGELHAFLHQHIAAQCELVGAVLGLVYLAKAGPRPAGIIARHVSAAGGFDTRTMAAVTGRLEKIGAEVARTPEGPNGTPGRIERIANPRPDAVYGEDGGLPVLASPLMAEGRIEGVCLLLLPSRQVRDGDAALRQLALFNARFEAFLWRQQCLAEAEQKIRLREAIELLDASQQAATAGAMGAILCHELRRRFGCIRVSIGLVQHDPIKLVAVSGADEIDTRGPAAETLEAAMEECAAQDTEVIFPPPAEFEADPAERRVTRAHGELSRVSGPSSILSLPLRVDGDLVGVILLERESSDPFPAAAVVLLRLIAETIGPALWTRRLADRGVLAVCRDRSLELGSAIVGPRHTAWKLVGLVAIIVLVLLAAVPIPSRVNGDATVLPSVSRTITPPFNGYLQEVFVKPGDRVTVGQALAQMRTEDLRYQLSETRATIASLATQRDDALAKRDTAQFRVLEAEIARYEATMSLLEDRLEKSTIRSPLEGVIAQGELEQYIDAPLEVTQALFQVVEPGHRAIVQVGERDIARVEAGQEGRLMSKALPGREIPVRVVRVHPMAEAVQGGNVYRAELELLEDPGFLRPGATGTVKLRDGWTTGLSSLLRPVIDELRMRLWL